MSVDIDHKSEEHKKLIEARDRLVNNISNGFFNSQYPNRAFYMEILDSGMCIEIRIPPSFPAEVADSHSNIFARCKACPAIEIIELPPELQRLGIFTTLVETLGASNSVDCVCVTNVHNEQFRQWLGNASDWSNLETPDDSFSPDFAHRNFYKLFI